MAHDLNIENGKASMMYVGNTSLPFGLNLFSQLILNLFNPLINKPALPSPKKRQGPKAPAGRHNPHSPN